MVINTCNYKNASDTGAMLEEALTWGKIRINGEYEKVSSEVSLVLPIIVAATFKKHID